jgi:hypothetical protein
MFIKLLVIAGLVRLLIASENPLLCAGIYTGIALIFSLISGIPLLAVLIACVITFGLTFLYFFLLNKFDTGSAVWWIIAIAGVVLIFL